MVGTLTNVAIFFFLKDPLGKTMYYTVWSVDRPSPVVSLVHLKFKPKKQIQYVYFWIMNDGSCQNVAKTESYLLVSCN